MLHKLQYISQGQTPTEHLHNISTVLDAGVKLIQLRLKNVDQDSYLHYASRAKELCLQYKSQLIINDNPVIAAKCGADAVHLGLDDMQVSEARKHLDRTIIGGTANTYEQVKQRCKEKVHYIGLGPYTFTTTKEKLSPVLGTEGYHRILQQMKSDNFTIPVYAIGGIEYKDIQGVMNTGVYGIAVSGLLTRSDNKPALVKEINKLLYHA